MKKSLLALLVVITVAAPGTVCAENEGATLPADRGTAGEAAAPLEADTPSLAAAVNGERGHTRLCRDERTRIFLVNGDLCPDPALAAVEAAALRSWLVSAEGRQARVVHVMLQLDHVPTDAEKEELAGNGVQLGDYLPHLAWVASVQVEQVEALLRRSGVLFVQHWTAADKLHPRLARGEVGPWAVDEVAGLVHVLVYVHKDVDLDVGKELLEAAGGITTGVWESAHAWSVAVNREEFATLANDERVYWVEEYPPPLDPMNDGARADLKVQPGVQDAPYNLTGAGSNAFVFDGGRARLTHEQFTTPTRITSLDSTATADHSTHVACTVAGDGNPTTRPKGMAPGAWILTAGYQQSSGELFYNSYGDMVTDYSAARNDGSHPADLATNSIGANVVLNGYSCAHEGDYGSSAQRIDMIVRGDESGIAGTYKRYIVTWAAGNERTSCTAPSGSCTTPTGRCGGGYSTLPPPASAKNPITVGATNSDYDSMTDFSSWGPTDSGRLKPVITGPGCESMGEGGLYSAINTSNTAYGIMCGTSMATPAIAGVIALILERYHTIHVTTNEPWNAAVKALLIHTAKDLGPVGPDFMTGFGRVDAKAAVDLLDADNAGSPSAYFHDVNYDTPASISQGNDQTFAVSVPAGTKELKVTLAWDDYYSAAASTGAIVNNLDLEVHSPSAAISYPWVLSSASPWLAATTGVNSVDNQEQVVVANPAAGTWTIHVKGTAVPQGPQTYGLVYTYTADPSWSCTTPINYSPATANGGFETTGSWTLGGSAARDSTANHHHSGSWGLKLGGANSANDTAYQSVTIPADAVRANLSYWWRLETVDYWAGFDFLRVEVWNSAGTTQLADLDLYHNGVLIEHSQSSSDYAFYAWRWAQTDNVDLLPWKGQTVRLYFRGTCDTVDATTFWVDDVRLEICTPGSCTAPTGLTNNTAADLDACADTGVQVSWTQDATNWGDSGSGTRTYTVLRNGSTIGGGCTGNIAYGTTTCNDNTGTNGTSYTYTVRYNNGCGQNATTTPGAAATDVAGSPPTFAGVYSAADRDPCEDSGVRVTWSAPSSWNDSGGSRSFVVRRGGVGISGSLPEGSTYFDDTAGVNGTSYAYSVVATNGLGCSTDGGASRTASDQVGSAPTFAGLTSVTALTGACGLRLSWSAATSNCSAGPTLVYNVYRSTSSGFTPGAGNRIATCVPDLFYEDTAGIVGGTPYYYVVRAEDSSVGHGGPCGTGFEESNTVERSGSAASGCSSPPNPVQFFTATGTSTQNKLEWLLPAGETQVRIVWRTDRFPTSTTDYLGSDFHDQVDGAPADRYDSWDHTGLTNNLTYYYAVFVRSGGGVYSAIQTVSSRPQLTTGAVKWVYNTGATALAPPGIGSVYGESNDRALHSMVAGGSGGSWPRPSWTPLAMNGPAQGRPPVVAFVEAPYPGGSATNSKAVFLGSQDGYVYAVNAVSGAQVWGVQPAGAGTIVQAAPAGVFSQFSSGKPDLILVGSRNAGQDNTFYALDLVDGSTEWSYNGAVGNRIGIISGVAWVDYSTPPKVYFASRERSAGSGTLWCLEFGASSASLCNGGSGWPVALGDVDGAPVVRNGTVYVGNTAGVVYAVNGTTGAQEWSYPTNDGPVKGFIWPVWGSDDLYLSTTGTVWALEDAGSHLRWSRSIASASPPLVLSFADPNDNRVAVGSTLGRLYLLNAATDGSDVSGWPLTLGAGNMTVGGPAFQVETGLGYAGTESGAVFAVQLD